MLNRSLFYHMHGFSIILEIYMFKIEMFSIFWHGYDLFFLISLPDF